MKKHFPILFVMIACLQACVFRGNEPQKPSRPSGGKVWWEETDSNKVYSGRTTDTIVIRSDETNNENNEPLTTNKPETIPNFVPTSKYDVCTVNGVMAFNVYLGWRVGEMETVVLIRDFPSEGGEIVFNIYTNNLSMSMYGFEKYRTDFYTFSSEPPYCGYSSYSLDTQAVCKYKMVITANNTGVERLCSGYWACNNGANFYSSFKIILYQAAQYRNTSG